jgi:hypothetical protein
VQVLDPGEADEYLAGFVGVTPEVLTDGGWLLERQEFWFGLVDGCADPDLVIALVGDHHDTLLELDQAIRESGRWPVLRIESENGDVAVVCWHGVDFEGGSDYLVLPTGSGRALRVASAEGHGEGPGLSWPEVNQLARRGRLGTPAQRLMLLLPALGDADVPETAIEMVAQAVLEISDRADDAAMATEMARQLVDPDARWTRHGDALICDDEYSPRSLGRMTGEDLRLVTRALAPEATEGRE